MIGTKIQYRKWKPFRVIQEESDLTGDIQFSSVKSLRRVQLFATPWIAARQASLSITNSRSSPRLTSIKSVMPSSHLILCRPLLLLLAMWDIRGVKLPKELEEWTSQAQHGLWSSRASSPWWLPTSGGSVAATTAKSSPSYNLTRSLPRASQVVPVVKNPPASAGDIRDVGSFPESGRSPGGGHGNPLQYSCLENPMDRRAWWATVHRVAQSHTQLKRLSTHTHQWLRVPLPT